LTGRTIHSASMNLTQKPQLHEDWIDSFALRIVKNLQEGGFETYLVGGCVRDLLVGIHPKDFDIATSALPNQVRKKVSNAYVIGRRFKLVLVKRGDQQFEVATFRRNVSADEMSQMS
jgi:poly(A) polymerase